MTDREAFEAWAAENHYDTRDPHDPALVDAWQGWKARAARAQPAQAVPVLTSDEIDAAGNAEGYDDLYGIGFYAGARWAEARLRGIVGKEGA